MKQPEIIEAEEGDDFTQYVKMTKKGWEDVKSGEQIGVEVWNPRLKKTELLLFSDIRFDN